MLKKRSLKFRLMSTMALAVLVPTLVVSLIGYQRMSSMGGYASKLCFDNLQEQAIGVMGDGVQRDKKMVETLFAGIETDTRMLANSALLRTYLQAKNGVEPTYNKYAETEVMRIVSGLAITCQTQQEWLTKKLVADLNVARRVLAEQGQLSLEAGQLQGRTVVNQLTKDEQKLELPALRVGNDVLTFTDDLNVPVVVVDEVSNLTGANCTLFQCMNEKGDMLRVATNIKTLEGRRAVGTYIPAVNPDGQANPVVARLLQGETYQGRAYVVNGWCITAYAPLFDLQKKLIGALYVGIPEQDVATLVDNTVKIKIGKTGYVFVMDSQGNLVVHPRAELVGKNTITDLKLTPFQEALTKRTAGETIFCNYDFEGRRKFIGYTYFPSWDWIICGSGYWDELSESAGNVVMASLHKEIEVFYASAQENTAAGAMNRYNQICFVDSAGQEKYKYEQGNWSESLGSQSDAEWFKKAAALNSDEIYNSGVYVASNGKPEVLLACPVVTDGRKEGVLAVTFDWTVADALLKASVYGQTGYTYVVNEQGILVSHPKHEAGEKLDFKDKAKFGSLAEVVAGSMLAGETGSKFYNFENTDRASCYTPLMIGSHRYAISTSTPVAEVVILAQQISDQTMTQTKHAAWFLVIVASCLITIGCVVGLLTGRGIARPLQRAITELESGVGQLNSASQQIASTSQSLAEGATEQAAGLEETSSSLEEMSSMTKQNADNAAQANNLSAQATKAAQTGNEAMERMNTAIEDISRSAGETAKILKVIDEIAFQTNLLALNAAVEAARAGEAGKGFAVVAEEVRNLAQRSAEAARNTATLIEGSVANAKNGVDIAGEVAKSLSEITDASRKVNELVSEIAAASQEQAQGVSQVNSAMSQMDKVTQQNAANAEESAGAAEELSTQSQRMKAMVDELVRLVGGGSLKTFQESFTVSSGGMSPVDTAYHHIAQSGRKETHEAALPLSE